MRRARWLMCACLLAGIGVQPASADTLGNAIADAYRNNPRLEAQRAQLRVLDEQVIQAASPYRLNVGVVASLSYQEQVQRAGFFNDFQKFDQKMMGAAVSVSQILSTGGRTAAQLSASEADVLSGRERLREVENFILFEVVDSYVSVRRDSRIVAIQERSVGSYERQVQQAQARERGGDLTRVDIAQAQAQLLIIRTSLAQARASLEQSRARFAAVVGRNPGVLEPEPALPGLPTSIDTAYQIAEKESPTLWQAILNERAGRSRVAAARAERNPTIATEGRYGYNAPASYNVRDMGRALSGVVTVTVPLINQGVVGSQIRAAIANQQSLSFLIEDTRRSVDSALLNAWNQSITSQDQVTNGQAAVEAAQVALDGVRRGFAEGFRSNFEVLDSEQRLLNAQLILANAQYSQYAGQANVLAYLGRLQAAAIDQAVAIYDSAANLEKQKRSQLSPFTAIVRAFDSIQVPSSRNRAAPILPPATDTTVIAAVAPPPSGPLATTLPVDPTGRPTPPEGEAPSQRR